MLTWHFLTRAAYEAGASNLKDDGLYFLSDTHEIFKKDVPFTEAIRLYEDGSEPEHKAVGKIYVNKTTLEGKVWDGSAWTTVIQPVLGAISTGDTTKPVSSKAVEDYVTKKIEDVTGSGDLLASLSWTGAEAKLVVTKADESTEDIVLSDMATDLVYNKETGLLQVKDVTGKALGTGINLDLERFVSAAGYDASHKKIVLAFNDVAKIVFGDYTYPDTMPADPTDGTLVKAKTTATEEEPTEKWYVYATDAWTELAADETPLEINVGDLVDTYTAKNSQTIKLTVSQNEFTAEAIVSTQGGNMLQATEQGLYVAAVDISGKADKVASATENNLAGLSADGNLKDSGVKAGGATLAAEPNAATLATEAAVAAVRSALQSAIDGKMNKVTTGHADEILLADADGQAKLSGVKAGGATLAADPNAATLATEAGVAAYVGEKTVAKTAISTTMPASSIAGSDEKVLSEKAVATALEWKTTV